MHHFIFQGGTARTNVIQLRPFVAASIAAPFAHVEVNPLVSTAAF